MSDKTEYKTPSLTVDAIIYNWAKNEILLIERKNPPHGWALPGGFVDYGESLEDAITREVKEEIGLEVIGCNQFKAYSKPNRDPRLHVVSMVFECVLTEVVTAKAGDDAKNLGWFNIKKLPIMAFDHETIINDYIQDKVIQKNCGHNCSKCIHHNSFKTGDYITGVDRSYKRTLYKVVEHDKSNFEPASVIGVAYTGELFDLSKNNVIPTFTCRYRLATETEIKSYLETGDSE